MTGHRRNLYDSDWNLLNVTLYYPNGTTVDRPETLEEMIALAKKLSGDFSFVRVDLYTVEKKVYFGELTFTPTDGMKPFTPKDFGFELGAKWNFP